MKMLSAMLDFPENNWIYKSVVRNKFIRNKNMLEMESWDDMDI